MDLWTYTILFVGVAVSWIGIPIVGGAALAGAGVLAGDGQLDVWLVILVAVAGASIGGYVGYLIGARAGDALTSRPGRGQGQRRRALHAGERFYRRWGPLAVFLTPTWVSGALRMPRNSFLVWNATAALVSSLATVFGAYAVASAVLGQVSARGGLAVTVLAAATAAAAAMACAVLHRRRARPELQPDRDTPSRTKAQTVTGRDDRRRAWPHDDDRHVRSHPGPE
jgi:membrane protein DedA with SNARE-associated domain